MGAVLGTLLAAVGSWIADAVISGLVSGGIIVAEYAYTAEALLAGIELVEVGGVGSTAIIEGVVTGYKLSLFGTAIAGVTATGILIGTSFGIVQSALNSVFSAPKTLDPLKPSFGASVCLLSQLLYGKNDGLQCRSSGLKSMRLQTGVKRSNSLRPIKEEVSLSPRSRSVQHKKCRPAKSGPVDVKKRRVRKRNVK